MGIIWAGLAPHPPIIVEAVGGDRCGEVLTTIQSMRALASGLLARDPDRLVIVSPHTPRPHHGIAAWSVPVIGGSFSNFGAPGSRLELPVDTDWLELFKQNYNSVSDLGYEPLDHGAMVPLHFLFEAGWRGNTVVIGLPWKEDEELDIIGQAIRQASSDPLRTAVLASGDMSHCLLADGPYGYDEHGPRFDNRFVYLVRQAHYEKVLGIERDLVSAAKQDVVESCRVVWEATGYMNQNHHFYSYEGPFGVGYTVMRFFGESS